MICDIKNITIIKKMTLKKVLIKNHFIDYHLFKLLK